MFEHSLIDLEAQARKKSRRGWFSLPVAVLLHLVALATFTFAGYWDVGAVPEPPLNDVFFVQMPPLPPPPIRGSGQPEKPTAVKPPEVKPPTQQETVQPRDVPDQLPPVVSTVTSEVVNDLLPPNGDPDGVDKGGVEDGVRDGVPFSNGDRTTPVTSLIPGPAEPANDKPILVGGAVLRPVAIYQPQPRYTETARKARVQGTVLLKAVIDERGNVTDLEVLRGQPMGLDKSALDAVRTWRFKPATLHGQPVKVYFTLTVNFQLN